jgi:hypothetical protein
VLGLAIVGSGVDEVLYSEAPPPTTGDVTVGSVIDLGDGAIARITRTSDGIELVEDVDASAVRIEIRSVGGTWTTCTAPDCQAPVHVAPWKQRMFTEDHVVRWVLVALSILAIAAASGPAWRTIRDRRRPMKRRLQVAAGVVALVALPIWLFASDGFDSASTWLLTGAPDDGAPAFKRWVSTGASELGEYRIEVIVLVMIGVAVFAGIAYDLTLRRAVRRARVWIGVRR